MLFLQKRAMKTVLALAVSPLLALLFSAIWTVTTGRSASIHDVENSLFDAYAGSIVVGIPALLVTKALSLRKVFYFITLGFIVGAVTYWIMFQVLPVANAYSDGRYTGSQALQVAITLLSFQTLLEYAVAGGCSGL